MLDLRLYMAQRITVLIIAPLVIGHIAVMIYAVQGGLSAGEILGRTRGSLFRALFYGGFVIAVSIHAAIGLRTVMSEWTGLHRRALNAFSWSILAVLLVMGGRAVLAVTWAGAGT